MATTFVDDLVREYLLYRGLSGTVKQLDAELKIDKDRSYRADKVVDQITAYINTHDLQSLRDLWSHFDSHLFSKLEKDFMPAVRKLEQGIFKLYLITAYSANKTDKVNEFFARLSGELHGQPEWREWFFFPFCKAPEDSPAFQVHFTKVWQDTLMISLYNFLATVFQCMPQPTLMRTEAEVALVKRLQDENALLRNRLQTNGTGPSHQSRLTTFQVDAGRRTSTALALNDIVPCTLNPPLHVMDDFYTIAQDTLSVVNSAETQTRGLKSLIRNISSGTSPVMGRKDGSRESKKRSGSVGGGRASTSGQQ